MTAATAGTDAAVDLSPLFEPISVGNVEIRNRVVMAGHGTGLAEKPVTVPDVDTVILAGWHRPVNNLYFALKKLGVPLLAGWATPSPPGRCSKQFTKASAWLAPSTTRR